MDLTGATIRDLRAALDAGALTCVELVGLYLNRIGHYDRHGICLNAVPVLNPKVFDEARASDRRREAGKALGPLEGIPYLAKDSYAAAGLTVAAGSPAFENLVAQKDAFAIERLRAAGAILIGLTNMPPMAAGGMQRGVYGRAESPFNAAYLTAAFASGSSNGSGSGTAACFSAFSLAEETWSSGRAPASNNGLCAYTPSRGLISIRGNWPLIATMDVVVPYARCMDDLLEILNVLVVEDPQTRGDLWRRQRAVELPSPHDIRPPDFLSLRDRNALAGKRVGVPKMYINKDPGSPRPITTRPSILRLWSLAERELQELGAQIVEVDFPAVTNYEKPATDAASLVGRGLVPKEFPPSEGWHLVMHGWDDFLRANGDPHLSSLAQVDGAQIFPLIPGALPDLYEGIPDFAKLTDAARQGVKALEEIPFLEEGLKGLEQARRIDLENWMDGLNLDALVFPAVADVAPADSDYDPVSQQAAWRNGVWVANGNQAIRHLGIPTVTTCMGVMEDTHMPVGLTFAGRAYDDNALLSYAYAFEQSHARHAVPVRTPPLPGERIVGDGARMRRADARLIDVRDADVRDIGTRKGDDRLTTGGDIGHRGAGPKPQWRAEALPLTAEGLIPIDITGEAPAEINQISVFVNGQPVAVRRQGHAWRARILLPHDIHYRFHSRWRGPYGSLVVVLMSAAGGEVVGGYQVAGGIA